MKLNARLAGTSVSGVFGTVRRNTETRVFLLEAVAVCYAFTAAAFRSDWPSISNDPGALLRLAIPAGAVLAVLLIRDGFGNPERRTQLTSTLDVTIAFAIAVLSQIVLGAVAGDLVLPRWAPTQGGLAGWICLFITRALFLPGPRISSSAAQGPPASLEEIQRKAHELAEAVRLRNIVFYVSLGPLFASFAGHYLITNIPRARAGSALILAGALYVVVEIRRLGLPQKAPQNGSLNLYADDYRRALQRQSRLLHRIYYWYFWSLLPGWLLNLLGSRVYEYFVVLYILLIAEVTLRAAETVQRDLQELNSSPR